MVKEYSGQEYLKLTVKSWTLGIFGGWTDWKNGVIQSDSPDYGDFYDIQNIATNPGLEELRVWTPEQFALLKLVGVFSLRKNTVIMGGLDSRMYCFRAPESSETIHRWHDPLPRYIKTWTFDPDKFFQMLEDLDVSNLLPANEEYVVDTMEQARVAMEATTGVWIANPTASYLNGSGPVYKRIRIGDYYIRSANDGGAIHQATYRFLHEVAKVECWAKYQDRDVQNRVDVRMIDLLFQWKAEMGEKWTAELESLLQSHYDSFSKQAPYIRFNSIIGGMFIYDLNPNHLPVLEEFCIKEGLELQITSLTKWGSLKLVILDNISFSQSIWIKKFLRGLIWA